MSTKTEVKPDPTMAKMRDLIARAQAGDRSAVPDLRNLLDNTPEIWKQAGDLAAQAEAAWKQMIAGPDLLLAESLDRQVAAMKGELSGPQPSPLEKLLVARIVACWLQLHHSEATYTRMDGAPPALHLAAQKRIGMSQTRYLQAIRTLATVRKLIQPALSPMQVASRLDHNARPAHRRDARPLVGVTN
jgi:hypothetical protein